MSASTTAPATSSILEVSDLHAGYGKAEVLTGVGLRVPAANVITVIGPNGAGKSTLLNALMGILPARGSIIFAGEDIGALTLEERVARGIALVPERRELFGSMTVEDNLVLGAYRHRRLGTTAIRAGLDAVYARFPRLAERRKQLAGSMSGGERQMIAIGRALMSQPRLLMLDEPSLGLAPLIVRDIFSVIDQLRATGVTIVLIEQNARAALEVADYGYVIETGSFVLEGPAPQLAQDARVIETYLGAHVGT